MFAKNKSVILLLVSIAVVVIGVTLAVVFQAKKTDESLFAGKALEFAKPASISGKLIASTPTGMTVLDESGKVERDISVPTLSSLFGGETFQSTAGGNYSLSPDGRYLAVFDPYLSSQDYYSSASQKNATASTITVYSTQGNDKQEVLKTSKQLQIVAVAWGNDSKKIGFMATKSPQSGGDVVPFVGFFYDTSPSSSLYLGKVNITNGEVESTKYPGKSYYSTYSMDFLGFDNDKYYVIDQYYLTTIESGKATRDDKSLVDHSSPSSYGSVLAFSKDRTRFVSVSGSQIALYNLPSSTRSIISLNNTTSLQVMAASLNDNATKLAIVTAPSSARAYPDSNKTPTEYGLTLWNYDLSANTAVKVKEWNQSLLTPPSLVFSPDSTKIAILNRSSESAGLLDTPVLEVVTFADKAVTNLNISAPLNQLWSWL